MIVNGYQDVLFMFFVYFGYVYEYKFVVEGMYGIVIFFYWCMNIEGEFNFKSVGQVRFVQKVMIEEFGIMFVNVYMGLSEEECVMQVEEFLSFVESELVVYVILGDMNVEFDEKVIQIIIQEYKDVFEERLFYIFNWGDIDIENIDYIFLRRGWLVKVKDYGCFCEVEVFDYRLVWVLIEFL